jgi:acyl carrier protein
MVPSTYVVLDSLPLNHNMKVDRRALPEPDASDRRINGREAHREPRSRTEKRLASLWMKLLGLDRIGLDEHFFDLGGHSVLGINLILDVESELGVVLTGMEVLRESLEGQAAICDRRMGAAPAPSESATTAPPAPEDESEAFYFGEGRSLYGVLSGAAASEAVLICPSVGQEHFRAHFILQRLAKRLAAQGVPALRFDYYGCGDSLGESGAATCGRWRRDIGEAYRELKRRTGATRITAVGVRLGAALLGGAAADLDIAKLVYWDPVCDGAKYAAAAAETHAQFVRSWRWLFGGPPAPAGGGSELLGLTYSETNMRELMTLRLSPSKSRVETLELDSGWNDAARLGDLMPDAGISLRLAAMATERS